LAEYTTIYRYLTGLYGSVPFHLGRGYAFPPLHVFIESTYRCNLSCEMCQFFKFMKDSAGRKTKHEEITFDEIKGLSRELPWYTVMTFTGGELFVRRDIMDILEWTCARRRTSIITNGTLVDEERAARLVGLAPRGLLSKGLLLVDVSLEGMRDVHEGITGVRGSYDKTVAAIRHIAAARKRSGKKYPLINIKTVISDRNLAELSALYSLAKESGADIFNPMIYSGIEAHTLRMDCIRTGMTDVKPDPGVDVDPALLKEQLDEIVAKSKEPGAPQIRLTPADMPMSEVVSYYARELSMEDYICRSPWSVVAVSAFGEVSVCPYFSFGSIRKASFRDIWNCEDMRTFRKNLKKDAIYNGCHGCCNMKYDGSAR